MYILAVYFHKFNPGVDRWQLLATHTSKSLCEPDMRISMFNCDVSQTLSAINSAADSIKIISTDLWVFLSLLILNHEKNTIQPYISILVRSVRCSSLTFYQIHGGPLHLWLAIQQFQYKYTGRKACSAFLKLTFSNFA